MNLKVAPLATIAALAVALVVVSVVGAAVRHTTELPSSFVATAASGETTARREVALRASDLNGDGAIDLADLIEVVRSFGRPLEQGSGPDLNGDDAVDVFDLAIITRNLGVTLSPQE